MNMILGQVFGILAMVLTFASYQANTKRLLLMIQTLSTACTCLGFFFLGATTGFLLNILCVIRNVVFYFLDRTSRLYYPATGILSVLYIVLGILSWQGWFSLFVTLALVINTVVMSLGVPQILRKSILITSPMVIVYNVVVFSIGGIANECVAIAGAVVGLIRYRSAMKKGSLKISS